MLLAALTSLIFTLILGPKFIKKLYELKTGQSIRVEDCPMLAQLHQKKRDTPTMGGVLILSSMLLSLFLWMDFQSSFTWILLLTTLWVGAIGAYDDYLKIRHKNSKGLRSKRKFLFQALFAALLALYLLVPSVSAFIFVHTGIQPPSVLHEIATYYFPFIKDPLFVLEGVGTLLAFFFILFVVVGSSNAVNLTDGLDGLASGCLIMTAIVLAIVAFFSNNYELSRYLNILHIEEGGEIAIYLFALVGGCLGFLWFNGSPAQIFMGDTGSLALGAIMGVSSILLRREFLWALVGGIFVMETLSVMIQVASFRLRKGKRVFLCTPFHHHFEYKGWPETKVVLRFWIVTFLLCLVGVVSLKLQ